MGISSAEIADFIEQIVKQQNQQGAVGKLTGEKGYKSVKSVLMPDLTLPGGDR